jgi:hypothetical protein
MKTLKFVFAVFLSIVAIGSALVYGESIVKTIQVTYRNISIQVNGRIVSSDQEPFIYQGRTFVPLRTIGEALGKTVEWDNGKNQVVINDAPADKPQGFLSFPIHELGERIEAYPYAVTVNKAIRLPERSKGGDIGIEFVLENISNKNLAFNEFSAFSLFDLNGTKFRFSNEVDLYKSRHKDNTLFPDVISFLQPGETDATAKVYFINHTDYLNKSLVFVFQPKLLWLDLSVPPIEEANVFVAVDFGRLK